MSPTPVTVTSYNMHKGMSALNRKVQLNSMADALHDLRTGFPNSRITIFWASGCRITAVTAKMPFIRSDITAMPF